ncbi:hypothetical protein Lepto7376_2041 [[Leptolyngbya] sp. PCC 7376]|nr:hypothetical protein Lepto7376_2041 [[Leptolyngbya] sp. PCC 7376]
MLIGRVLATFEITGRGLVVATDILLNELPCNAQAISGSQIEFRIHGVINNVATVHGVEMPTPLNDRTPFAFSLSSGISKNDIRIGSEFAIILQSKVDLRNS